MKKKQLKPEQAVFIDMSVREAFQKLTQLNKTILAVIDDNFTLVGIVTDGDLQRALSRGVSLQDKINLVYNEDPIKGNVKKSDAELFQLMSEVKLDQLPVVDLNGVFIRFKQFEKKIIENAVPNLSEEEIKSIGEAISSNFVALGPHNTKFENAICEFSGSKYAVATSSGTSALHLSLIAANVQPEDIVLTSTLSFAATANAIRYVQANPLFFDVDEQSLCIDVKKVESYLNKKCTFNGAETIDNESGQIVKAIMPVHLYGHPANLRALRNLASQYSLKIIEDGAEALGAVFSDERVGENSLLCVLSFNGNKIITTGAGGMVLTNSRTLSTKIRYFANQCKQDGHLFFHDDIGYNYRMANVNAAIGCTQAKKLPTFLTKKRRIASIYRELLDGLDGVSMSWEQSEVKSSFWMPILRVDTRNRKIKIQSFINYMSSYGIGVRNIWFPLHRQKAFKDCASYEIKIAEKIFESSVCLPCSTAISESDQVVVVDRIKKFFDDFKSD